jgi:hypothetical protein
MRSRRSPGSFAFPPRVEHDVAVDDEHGRTDRGDDAAEAAEAADEDPDRGDEIPSGSGRVRDGEIGVLWRAVG